MIKTDKGFQTAITKQTTQGTDASYEALQEFFAKEGKQGTEILNIDVTGTTNRIYEEYLATNTNDDTELTVVYWTIYQRGEGDLHAALQHVR